MKWFQHQSDSHINLKLQKFCRIFGMEGYGFYWLVTELVAQQGINYTVKKDKDWREWLEIQSRLQKEKMDAMLEKMAEFDLINSKAYKSEVLSIPQMSEYSDDYTNRVRRVSEHSPNSVRQDKIRIDKNRIDKEDNTATVKPSQDIVKIFDIFIKVNPAIKRMYGNKTQRDAAENLIKQFGIDKVCGRAEFAIAILGVPYAPKVTTPYLLETKWADLEAFYHSERGKREEKSFKIGL